MDTKNEISARFVEAYHELLELDEISDKKDFALKIGISPSMVTEISKGRSSVGLTAIQNIVLKFNISSEWLLTGNGSMFKERSNTISSDLPKTKNYVLQPTSSDIAAEPEAIPFANVMEKGIKPIPLVTATAAAGFGNGNFSIAEKDVKEYYVIPKFRFSQVDFMIEVSGLSMYPQFNSGDVVACTILHDRKFLQWNKCHVIATREQGLLVKRLMPSTQDGCLTAVSNNKDYPPFDIPMDEITGIALVVGAVSLE